MSKRHPRAAPAASRIPGLQNLSIHAILLDQTDPTVVDLERPVMTDSVLPNPLGYYMVIEWSYRDLLTGESGAVDVPTLVRTKDGSGWEYLVALPHAATRNYESLNENMRVVRRPNEWSLNERRQVQDLQERHAFSIEEAMDDESDHSQNLATMQDPDSLNRFYEGVLLKKLALVRELLLKLTDEQLEAYWGWGLDLSLQLIPDFDPDKSKAACLAQLKQARLNFIREEEAAQQRADADAGVVDPDLYD